MADEPALSAAVSDFAVLGRQHRGWPLRRGPDSSDDPVLRSLAGAFAIVLPFAWQKFIEE